MESTLKVPLMEQEQLEELLRILDEKGMTEEKEQVSGLAQYLDAMDTQLGAVLKELGDVKEQLGVIQDQGIKAAAVRVVAKVEGKVQEAREQIHVLKEKFMEGVQKTVKNFREKGVLTLAKMIDFLGLQKGIQTVHNQLSQSVLSMDRGIDRLGSMADELHAAKTHIGNIGRELAGKESVKTPGRDMERGSVFQIQKGLYHVMGVTAGMKDRTEKMLSKMERLTEHAEHLKKPSIRESLKSIQSEGTEHEKDREETGHDKHASISFFAAECMEFHNFGEMQENLTLQEAVREYQRIRRKGSAKGPGIGFVLQDPTIPDYSGIQWPLFNRREIAAEELKLIPEYQNHPLVKEAVGELKQYLPELTKNEKQKKTPER